MSGKPATIVLFVGESNYGNIGSMVPSLASGFQRAGHHTEILDLRHPDFPSQIRSAVESGTLGAFVCVSGFGLPPDPDSRAVKLFNDADVPVVGVFLDHPFQLLDRIDLPLARYHASFPAMHAGRFCRTYIRDDITYHHLAHGGDVRATVPWPERDISIVLTGSVFLPPEQQRARWRDHGRDVERNLNDIVDLARQDLARPLENSVIDVIGGDGMSFDRIFPYMKTVDDFLRNAHRIECVQALAALPLVIVGRGWEVFADDMPGVRFMGEMSISETLSVIDRSKAVLNPFPGYNDSHERVFNAMAGGGAVLTNRSAFLGEAFDEMEIFFLANDPGQLADPVGDLIADDDRLAVLAARGRARMKAAHTWTARARSIEGWIGLRNR